jgi:Domain of unknown function (DUF4070)
MSWRGLNVQGITTMEGLNFIPKGELTKREYLEGYAKLLKELYAPKAYFGRILTALLALRCKVPPRARYNALWKGLKGGVPVPLRLLYYLGIKAKGARFYFWKTLFHVLWKNRAALEAFGHDVVMFHHLNRHAEYAQRQISRYLSSPPPDDVLDEVIRDSESSGPKSSKIAAI